jgi:hypothetical protein
LPIDGRLDEGSDVLDDHYPRPKASHPVDYIMAELIPGIEVVHFPESGEALARRSRDQDVATTGGPDISDVGNFDVVSEISRICRRSDAVQL